MAVKPAARDRISVSASARLITLVMTGSSWRWPKAEKSGECKLVGKVGGKGCSFVVNDRVAIGFDPRRVILLPFRSQVKL